MVRSVLAAIVLALSTMTAAPAAGQQPFDFPRLPGPTIIATHLTSDGETVWTTDHATFERLIAIDATGGILYDKQIEGIVGPLKSAVFAGGSVWIPDLGGGVVHQVDAATGRQLVTIGNGRMHSHGVAVLDGSLWLSAYGDGSGDEVIRYDPVTGEEQARIQSPEPVYNLIAAGGYVWINRAYALARIDPATNQIESGPASEYEFEYDMWVGDGLLFAVTTDYPRKIAVIDPASGTLVRIIEPGVGFSDMAVTGGSLWGTFGDEVWQVDVASGEVVTKYRDAPHPLFIRITGSVMWLINVDDASAHQVQWFAMPALDGGAPQAVPEKVKPQKTK